MRKTHDTSISLVFFLCIHTRYQSSSLPFRVGGFWIPQNLAGGFTSGWSKFKERYQSLPPTHSQPIRCMMPMSQHRLNIQIPPQKVFKTYIYIQTYNFLIFQIQNDTFSGGTGYISMVLQTKNPFQATVDALCSDANSFRSFSAKSSRHITSSSEAHHRTCQKKTPKPKLMIYSF